MLMARAAGKAFFNNRGHMRCQEPDAHAYRFRVTLSDWWLTTNLNGFIKHLTARMLMRYVDLRCDDRDPVIGYTMSRRQHPVLPSHRLWR